MTRRATRYTFRLLAYICAPPRICAGCAAEGFTSISHIFRQRPDQCRWAVAIHLGATDPQTSAVVAIDLYALTVDAGGEVAHPAEALRVFRTTEAAETWCLLNYDAA